MVDDLLWANCSYGKIKSGQVPQDLDINIQVPKLPIKITMIPHLYYSSMIFLEYALYKIYIISFVP